MNNPQINELEQRLQRLTEWSGETPMPTLARLALQLAPASASDRSGRKLSNSVRRVRWVIGTAAVLFVLVGMFTSAGVVVEQTAKSFASRLSAYGTLSVGPPSALMGSEAPGDTVNREMERLDKLTPRESVLEARLRHGRNDGFQGSGGIWHASEERGASTENRSAARSLERQVVRKASLELRTDDVRGVLAKVQLLLSEARGEYVQESGLTGTLERPEATITLRVTAERLASVMNELRGLGRSVAERIAGDDITAQVVDLEARLRNEQRVEAELLELFETRKDAPLKDVLELRDAISAVRHDIELLSAQRETFARLVSLATIVVIIRTEDAPAVEPHEQTLAEYFAASIERAWNGGLRRLGDSVAGIVSVAVSGAVWWVLLIVAGLVVRRWVRK